MEREAEGATIERLAQVLTEIELKNLSRLLKGRRPWKGIRQFIILVATPVGKMKWTYVLIGYPSRQDEHPLDYLIGIAPFWFPAPEGSLKICVEPTYKLSNFWTISLIEMQKAAEDSQNKDLCDLSQFKLS